MTTLLEQMTAERLACRETLRQQTRRALRAALADLVPQSRVIVFGSLAQTGRFTEHSDVDIALETEPADVSLYQLTSLLSERLGRRVDVLLLPDCRFRERILREGERWTPPH